MPSYLGVGRIFKIFVSQSYSFIFKILRSQASSPIFQISDFQITSFIFKMLEYLTLSHIFQIFASQIYSFVFKMFYYLGDTRGKVLSTSKILMCYIITQLSLLPTSANSVLPACGLMLLRSRPLRKH